MPDFDIFSKTQEEEKLDVESTRQEAVARKAQASLSGALSENPDEYASYLKQSEELGMPVGAVRSDPKGVDAFARKKAMDFSGMSKRSPNTSEFLTNYDNASIAHDDTPILEKLEKQFSFAKTFQNITTTSSLAFQQMQKGAILSSISSNNGSLTPTSYYDKETGQWVDPDRQKMQDELIAELKVLEAATRGATPSNLNAVEEGVRGGVDSLIQMVPGLVATGLMRNPEPMLLAAGLQTHAQSYGSARTEGLDHDTSKLYATIDSSIEMLTEMVPTKLLGAMGLGNTAKDVVAGEVKKRLSKKLLEFGVSDVFGEQVATLGQTINAYAFDLDEELANASTIEEKLQIQARRQFVTLVATAVAGGTQASVAVGVGKTVDYVTKREEQKGQQYVKEQGFIDDVAEISTESNLRKRNATKFKQLIEKNDGDANTQVFVDAAQLRLYLNSKTPDQIAADPALQMLQVRSEETAVATATSENIDAGVDVAIPIADFATDIAGSDHFGELREFMTMNESSPAPFRVEQAREQTQNNLDRLVNEAQQDVENYTEAQTVFEEVRQQLIDSGSYSPQRTAVMAQVVPAWATIYARDNGITVREAYASSGLHVQGPQTEASETIRRNEVPAPIVTPEQVQRRIVPDNTAEEVGGAPTQERREEGGRREKVAAMSPEDQYKAIYLHELTGINNRRAFEEDLPNAKVVASIDGDSLKTVNDKLGHDAGDTLLKMIAADLNAEAGDKAFHISGDEFYVLGDTREEVESNIQRAQKLMAAREIKTADGMINGLQITYGFGNDKKTADHAMEQEKVAREERGERAGRGQIPSNMWLNDVAKHDVNMRILESSVFDEAVAADFTTAINAAKDASPNATSVHAYNENEYKNMSLYLADEGRVGFAITPSGDLVSVFKHPESTMQGALSQMMPLAVSLGARTLDAFEGPLTQAYAKHGFEEVGRAAFDEANAPDGWDFERSGKPDVIFMELNDEVARKAEEERGRIGSAVRGESGVLAQPVEQNQREADGSLRDLPRIKGWDAKHSDTIATVAEQYARENGFEYNPPATYQPVDAARARRIADEYESMEHSPQDPEVLAAYEALIDETVAQYEAALAAGLKVEFIDFEKQGDPYESSPRLANKDIVENNHMYVFSTRDGFGSDDKFDPVDNPLLRETPFLISGQPALVNDLFRVVHDYFGHAKEGLGFRAAGEENAWRAHSAMYSPLARRAMTTETRGQNSWVNYGPYGETNQTATAAETHFADQKVGLMPEWVSQEGAADPVVDNISLQQRVEFHSAVEVAVRDLKLPQWSAKSKTDDARGEDVWNKLKSTSVKKEELDWLGLEEFLTIDPDAKFTRQQVTDFVKENGVKMQPVEVVAEDTGETTPGELEWNDEVIEDSIEWDHITDDFMTQFDDAADFNEIAQEMWFVDTEGLSDEMWRIIDKDIEADVLGEETQQLVDERKVLVEKKEFEEAGQQTFDGVEKVDYDEAITRLDSKIERDMIENNPELRTFFEDKAEEAARDQYMDNPYRRWTTTNEGVDIEIVGNDDVGYHISHDGDRVGDDEIYSLDEAQIQAQGYAHEEGLIEGEDSVESAKWGQYVTDGDHENYREYKLTLPEIEGDFYNDVHFPDRNLLAFIRVTDRDLDGNAFFIEELQSDWHQTGRQKGYATGEVGQQNDEAVVDAPFKGDAWLTLSLKKALARAVENGHTRFAWANAPVLMDRWSKSYEKLYRIQYDTKMPSIIKKLTKQKPVEVDLDGNPIDKEMGAVLHAPLNTKEEVLEFIKGDDQLVDSKTGKLLPGLSVEQNADGLWNVYEPHTTEGFWSIDITDELRERVLSDGFTLFQEEARGYYEPANALIRLTETANLSTFLHEFAHFMYEMELKSSDSKKRDGIHNWMKRNVDDVTKEATGYYKQETPDFMSPPVEIHRGEVKRFLDEGSMGDKEKDAAIREAVHEQFARGFEAYLMEGKAPSVEMRGIFATFATWLAQIYKSIKGSLNVNMDDEMRDVFDRMLATEEQIQNARARAEQAPLFTDAAMAGMTDEEFAKYQEAQKDTKAKESETLRDKLIKELTRQTKSWWKREKADLVDEITVELKKKPVYRATETLRGETLKLDHAVVKELYGEEVTDKRGRKSVRIPPSLKGMTVTGAKGVHPDQAAAFFGFNSGDEMIQIIEQTPPLKVAAAEAAQEEMLNRHGDTLNDGSIEQTADDALQNEKRGELLLSELKALSRNSRVPTLDRATIKAMAEENIAKLAYKQIQPGKYRAAELRAAQEAATALANGDKTAAMHAKSRQVLNFYLGMAATKARAETLKIVDRMGRYNKKSVQTSIMSAGEDYWTQIVKILQRFEFRKSASMKGVDETNQNINTWMKEKIEQDGDGLVLSAAVLNEMYTTHWKNVPFSDLKGINDSVTNIEHVARYANKITRMGEEISFKNLVTRWVTKMNESESRFSPQRTDVVKGRKVGRWAMAQMTKIPFMASWLDGGERVGLSHEILVQPFTDALDAEIKLWDQVGRKVMDAITNRSKDDIKRHNRKLFIPEIKDESNDGHLMGHQVLAVALNVGNEGNLRKMLLGEGWADINDDSTINIENPKLQAVLAHMTKADWDLVQLIWNQMDQLYPMLAEVHRRTTGLTPPKVEAAPVETEYGTFAGGYYPLKYDGNRSHQASLNEDRLNAQVDSMFSTGGSIQSSVNTGTTNERTKYFAPIRLSLDVVANHFQETIHYITHHDAVREVNKLILDKQVAETIKAKLGPEEYAQLKPWLNSIAKDGQEGPTKMFWDSMLQKLRFGVTLGVMGFKVSTGLMQLLGVSNTVAEVGIGPVMQSFREILYSPERIQSAWEFATENSKVLAHRAQTMDREIKNAMRHLEGKRGALAAAQETSMKHIALIQTYAVDLPSWYAAYIKAMGEHGDEQKAYQYADWVIENVQGSGATKDLAAIMRGQSETGRMLTMFMTFFSSLWNMERDLVKGSRSKAYSKTTVAAKLMFLMVVPVILESLLRGDIDGDDEPEEQMQELLTKIALYPIQSIPFIRDIANGASGDYGYNMSPIASVIEQGTRTIPAVASAAFTDEEITLAQIKGTTKVAGAATGIPGVSQAWATGEHLYNVLIDGEDLTLRELGFGPSRD